MIRPPPSSPLFPYTTLFRSSRVKLPTETVYENGEVQIREYFTLRHHFKQEDLFDFGMLPQFLSRFDNSIILERSEEHTSELQSLRHLVCRLLLEKKKNNTQYDKIKHIAKIHKSAFRRQILKTQHNNLHIHQETITDNTEPA